MRLAELEIPARPEFVSLARLVVSSIADDRYELTDDQLDDLKLAVSEACVVAIESQGGSAAGGVAIACDGADDHLAITVDGRGSHFHGSASDELLGEQLMKTGSSSGKRDLGLPLIGTLVDEVEVESVDTGDRLKMTVFCPRAEDL